METLDAIKNRRSIRKFKNEKVDKFLIEDILNCGILAPSPKNRQPWEFVILTDSIKDKVVGIMKGYEKNKLKLITYHVKNKFFYSGNYTAKVIKNAPVLILVFRKKEDNWIVGDSLALGACIQNMSLRATDLGLGSLWIRDIIYTAEEISELVGKEDLELNSALCIGYPDENAKASSRKKLKDITKWY